MKMAKASEGDLSMAMDLANALEDIERGYFPLKFSENPESEIGERIDTDNRDQYDRLIDGLQRMLNRGSICRVVWGMAVVCDPSNECIDPEADTIEHHPKRQQLEKQLGDLQEALLWVLWHHQGSSSDIGQPIRKLLGIGKFDRLTDDQLKMANRFALSARVGVKVTT